MMRCLAFAMNVVGGCVLLASCGSGSGSGQVGTCTGAFDACGGDPTGQWDISSMCSEGDLARAINDATVGDLPSCANVVQSASMTFSGSVSYSNGTVTHDVSTTTTAKLSYTMACLADVRGTPTADASTCAALDASYKNSVVGTGSCTFTGATCDCDSTVHSTDTAVNGYTVSGGTITESDGSSYQFCVTAGTMSARIELAPGSYGVMTLTKQ
jgi:hypothetical protein